jgi:hypothetical protein
MEEPAVGRDASSVHCHPILPGVLGSTLIQERVSK